MQTAIKRDNCIIVILSHLYIEVQLFISIINFGFSILPKKNNGFSILPHAHRSRMKSENWHWRKPHLIDKIRNFQIAKKMNHSDS